MLLYLFSAGIRKFIFVCLFEIKNKMEKSTVVSRKIPLFCTEKIYFLWFFDYQIHQVVHDIHMMLQWMALLMCVQSWCLHDTEVKEVKECVNKLSLKQLIIESQLQDTKVREFSVWINKVINHVIILKDPSRLEKASYSKCHVFSSSIGILATPCLVP